MSFKHQAVREGTNRYVLPKLGDMRCDVVAFLSDELYQATAEDLWRDAGKSRASRRFYELVTNVN